MPNVALSIMLEKVFLTLLLPPQVYPLELGDKFRLVLATTLNEDGTPGDGEFNPLWENTPSRADQFEYVMYGKVGSDFNYVLLLNKIGDKNRTLWIMLLGVTNDWLPIPCFHLSNQLFVGSLQKFFLRSAHKTRALKNLTNL